MTKFYIVVPNHGKNISKLDDSTLSRWQIFKNQAGVEASSTKTLFIKTYLKQLLITHCYYSDCY